MAHRLRADRSGLLALAIPAPGNSAVRPHPPVPIGEAAAGHINGWALRRPGRRKLAAPGSPGAINMPEARLPALVGRQIPLGLQPDTPLQGKP